MDHSGRLEEINFGFNLLNQTINKVEITGKKDFLKSHVRTWQGQNKIIGFVPTMGALHAGHLSLVNEARKHCDVVVVSIFVNPLQFNNSGDLEKYPRNLESDLALLKNEPVDLVYAPEPRDFYPSTPKTSMDFGTVSAGLEGKMRPGHFSGVGIVVSRLFHLVQPHKAFFGAKDLQQLAIINAMVVDLGFEIEIFRCPTYREASGLAMSSRNSRLSKDGLISAAILYKGLAFAKNLVHQTGPKQAKIEALEYISSEKNVEVEYLEWVDASTMEIIQDDFKNKEIAICVAAWVEGVRLIDNLIV